MKYIQYVGSRGRVFNLRDRAGDVYGHLTVLAYVGRSDAAQPLWSCRCSCGGRVTVAANNLANGHTKSCGCLQKVGKETHGHSRHPLYPVWAGMMARCYDETNERWARYGGRGIRVCTRWHSIANFLSDMGDRPEGMTLERKHLNKWYSPSNCIWASPTTQANNKSNNVYLVFDGQRLTMAQWAKVMDIPVGTLQARLGKLGWSVERALTTAIGRGRRH